MKVLDLFTFHTGVLDALEKLDDGSVPLVYGTAENNGIVKFVTVESSSAIFVPPLITVSYLGTAFVQTVSFTTSVVDKSNIIVLKPIKKMDLGEMYYYCYQINKHGKFGFNYGRRMNMKRLEKLFMIPYENNISSKIKNVNTENIKPKISVIYDSTMVNYKDNVSITKVFEIVKAKSKGFESYDEGKIPFVSNGFYNKGIIGFVEPYKEDTIFDFPCLSVSAFCEVIVQEKPFIARGNGGSGLTILVPKKKMSTTTLQIYASYINIFCQWRFNYGRMVSKQRLEKLCIPNYLG